MKYGNYPQNIYFNDLPIEYEQRLFTKWPIDGLSDNILERLKVSLTNQLFDNRMYESSPQNSDFVDFNFDGDQRLISGQLIYRVNDDIVLGLNNGLIVDIYINRM